MQSEPEISSFEELVSIFVSEFPEKIREIRAAMEQSDTEQLRCLMHKLKGSAGGYGFGEITETASEARGLLQDADTISDETRIVLETLLSKCENVRSEQSTLLHSGFCR